MSDAAHTDTDTDAGADTAADVDLAPRLEGATEAVVRFHPQIWKDGYAVTGTNTETYVVPIEDVVTDDGRLPDGSEASEKLAQHDNAPERAREWRGPFFVHVDEVR